MDQGPSTVAMVAAAILSGFIVLLQGQWQVVWSQATRITAR